MAAKEAWSSLLIVRLMFSMASSHSLWPGALSLQRQNLGLIRIVGVMRVEMINMVITMVVVVIIW